MTDLTNASEARERLLSDPDIYQVAVHPHLPDVTGCWLCTLLDAYAEAVRSDTLADEARCAVCGEPTAMGQGLIVIDGKRQHQTCYMGIDQPAPTPAPPTPPPAGATQVPLPATDSTPPPAVDGTRCAECGGVKDDVFHVPCLVGGPFHYVKTCHPFTPPATEPVAALRDELERRVAAVLTKFAGDEIVDLADRYAAARAEVDVERLVEHIGTVHGGVGCCDERTLDHVVQTIRAYREAGPRRTA